MHCVLGKENYDLGGVKKQITAALYC
jgi:hypothetical protein